MTDKTLESIRGAIGRGYCRVPNGEKVVDPDLCEAMAQEVKLLFDATISELKAEHKGVHHEND